MQFAYHIVDVFSPEPFGGNQLAVLTNARGLSAEGMQQVAREFNFAETTFVLPPNDPVHTARVRIFTPAAELAFAGHPTIGTAAVLVRSGMTSGANLVLEEGIGPVRIAISHVGDALHAELTLEGAPQVPPHAPAPGDVAEMLSLPLSAVRSCFFAGYGLPFLFAHLTDAAAVDRARLARTAWSRALGEDAYSRNIFLFAGNLADGGALHARMFAPALGIEEDPATGSACVALVAAAAVQSGLHDGTVRLSVLQGVAMGRRSEIEARAERRGGAVLSASVGGVTAPVATGQIDVPARWLEG